MSEAEQLKIYGASILAHAPMWLALRQEQAWSQVHFTARWPGLVGTPEGPAFAKVFWRQDHEDIARAHMVMVYAAPEDRLRGALVEAGMALGQGKPVLLVGDNPGFGTWQHHPNVSRVSTLSEARQLLSLAFGWDAGMV